MKLVALLVILAAIVSLLKESSSLPTFPTKISECFDGKTLISKEGICGTVWGV